MAEESKKVNLMQLSGRIESARVYGGVHFTTVILPAPDQYSETQKVEVRSADPIGQEGSDVSVVVLPKGYVKTFTRRDSSQGANAIIWFELYGKPPVRIQKEQRQQPQYGQGRGYNGEVHPNAPQGYYGQ